MPFPARKNGISIRYYPIIEHASKQFDIHLLVISDDPIAAECIAEAEQFCKKVSIYQRTPKNISLLKKIYYRIKSFYPAGLPFPFLRYDEREIDNFFQQETKNVVYDIALSTTLKYAAQVKKHVRCAKLSIDVCDSAYSTRKRQVKRHLLDHYDIFMIKLWERRLIADAAYASYISPLDRQLGAGENIDKNKIVIIPNGLFFNDYTTKAIGFDSLSIGYLGHMAYPPNIKAALKLAAIYKNLKPEFPNLKLIIIGRDPSAEITSLAQDTNIVVTGTVDNIWPYVNGVDLFVFPMETGSGQQNKLLEAMGASKAVVSTSLGNSGIGATHQEQLIVADTDEEIEQAIKALLADKSKREKLGINAKSYVTSMYSWPAIFNTIDQSLLKIADKI